MVERVFYGIPHKHGEFHEVHHDSKTTKKDDDYVKTAWFTYLTRILTYSLFLT